MPWHIENDNAECSGFAVVKDADGEVEGCHETREEALAQVAALYAADEGGADRETSTAREKLVREFAAEMTEGDGRTVDVRIVPYNTPTEVVDSPANGGTGMPYTEVWDPGAFDKQLTAANRVDVFMNVEHEQGFRGVVGHGRELRSEDDALYGSFRIMENSDGDKALELVREQVLTGISLEAVSLASTREGPVVTRTRAHLDKVSLCRTGRPAYTDAVVLAVRESKLPEPPPALSPAVSDLLERVGFEPVVVRAVVRSPWDGSASRFTDEEYQRSTLVCRDGDEPVKTRCSLPVLEPNGDLNANALAAAASVLSGGRGGLGNVTREQKAAAARKLLRFYRQAKMDPPPSVVSLAGR